MHMSFRVLPKALTIVRLRQFHRQSKAPVGAEQLVDVVCKSLNNFNQVSPRSLLPTDITTVMALLELIEETNIILSEILSWPQNVVHRLHGRAPDRITDLSLLPHLGEGQLYIYQQALLAFELHIQALFRVQKLALARTDEREMYDRLSATIRVLMPECMPLPSTGTFKRIVWFVCYKNNEYIRSASRKVVGIRNLVGRPRLTSSITVREGARSLREALDDCVVSVASGNILHRSLPRTIQQLESLSGYYLAKPDIFYRVDLESTQVCTWHTKAGDKLVHRFLCYNEKELNRDFYAHDILFMRDENGFTAVAEVVTAAEQEAWDQIDEVNYLWQRVSGGISPLVRLLRMNGPDRLQFLVDNQRFIQTNQPNFGPKVGWLI
ncbi:hypothetical protein CSUB01_02284 [Colletotrichum sublineola]|uniref:Uncharacterized protein n=1 Tax=Colletotrichum sublineola TaxID=1173701 RepID=A0A066X0S9_COLSU|nr:hypothetical protein CSUB01_02284 [Colletotrichum sublineola]